MKKIKKQLEYPDAPSGYVTFYNYKEPLMKFNEGYGYQGCLLFDGKTDKIQCHLCGEWFLHLVPHIKNKHGIIKANQYKKLVGLSKNTALISESVREKLLAHGLEVRKKNLLKGRKKTEAEKKRISESLKEYHTSMEGKNKRGTCPAQLLDRLKKLYKELGRTPAKNEIGFYKTLIKVYGSMQNACKQANIPARKNGQNVNYNASKVNTKYDVAILLNKLIEFKVINGREPALTDTRRNLLPCAQTYYNYFNTWSNAKKIAFE